MGIKLEVGKRYVDRNGNIWGPLALSDAAMFPYVCTRKPEMSWTYSGRFSSTIYDAPNDLIALAPDEATEQPDELATLRERVRDLEEWNRKMVEMAASKNNLDGYRELGQRAAQAESIADALRAENAWLTGLVKTYLTAKSDCRAACKSDDDADYRVAAIAYEQAEKDLRAALARTEAENG